MLFHYWLPKSPSSDFFRSEAQFSDKTVGKTTKLKKLPHGPLKSLSISTFLAQRRCNQAKWKGAVHMNDEKACKRHLKYMLLVSTTVRTKVWHRLFANGFAVPVADENKWQGIHWIIGWSGPAVSENHLELAVCPLHPHFDQHVLTGRDAEIFGDWGVSNKQLHFCSEVSRSVQILKDGVKSEKSIILL